MTLPVPLPLYLVQNAFMTSRDYRYCCYVINDVIKKYYVTSRTTKISSISSICLSYSWKSMINHVYSWCNPNKFILKFIFGATAPPSSFLCNFVHSTCSQCALPVVHIFACSALGICTIGSVLSRINIWFPDVRWWVIVRIQQTRETEVFFLLLCPNPLSGS